MANANDIDASVLASDIVTYYDDCEIDYKWIWHLKDQSAMHYGYWTEDTDHIGTALQNTNKFVSDRLSPESGDHILDAGCGIGGTSRYLSLNFNVHVHGITLSEKQVKTATDLTSKARLKGSAEFSVQDYCHTSFPDNHFDKAYAIESVCHAAEKEDFLREAHRVLKSGGRLVVAGFFATRNIKSAADKKLMANWADSWAVPAYEEIESFITKAGRVGLTLKENHNVTSNIYRSARRLYRCFFPGIVCHTALRLIGMRNKVQGKNVWSTYYQYKALQKKLWEYRVFTFQKEIV